MRMHHGTINSYLRYLTSMTFVDTPDPLADLEVFDSAIDAMAAAARRDGNLDMLRLALDSLVSEPEDRIDTFRGEGFPFTQDEVVTILAHALRRLWPDIPVSGPGEAVPVDFIRMSRADWERETGTG